MTEPDWTAGLFLDPDPIPWPVITGLSPTVGEALEAAVVAQHNPREVARWRAGLAFGRDPWARSHCYHARHPRVLETLHCCCGDQIRGWVVDERFRFVAPNGAIHERLLLAPTHLYAEGLMRFDDGGRHVTHGCRECLTELAAPGALSEDLEQHYCRDLAQFLYEEEHFGAENPWQILAFRVPVALQVIEVGAAANG